MWETGWPFEDRRHAQAALVDAALLGAASRRPLHQAAVVAAVENQRVFRDLETPQRFPQPADLLVKEGDLAEISGVILILVIVERGGVRDVLRQFLMRIMRRRKPGDDEHRLVSAMVLFQETDRLIHRDHAARSLDLLIAAVAAQVWVVVEKVEAREPLVEARPAGVGGAVGLHRADVPLAEMSGDVARCLKRLGKGRFVGAQVMAVVRDVGAERVASGQNAGTCRRADGRGGVEAVEDDALTRHFIKVRRLHERVSREPAIAVSLVVHHDEQDVRFVFICGGAEDGKEQQGDEEGVAHKGRFGYVFLSIGLERRMPFIPAGDQISNKVFHFIRIHCDDRSRRYDRDLGNPSESSDPTTIGFAAGDPRESIMSS